MPSVLILGATGFLGVPLTRAIKQAHPDWPVTAFVRSQKPEQELKDYLHADHVIVGEFTDSAKISLASKEHDIVVNAGNSFTNEPVSAIIAGLKERPSTSKGKLIHISGAGNFIDHGTSGNFNSESRVWSDGKEDDIKAIHKDMFNGQSDTPVLEIGAQGAVETHIVCPSVVYGGASVSSSTLGIGYTLLTGNAKSLGYVAYVGEGTAVVSTCHVLDLLDFLVKIIDLSAQGAAEGTAYSRYYMVETGKVTWKDLTTELAKVLHSRGIVNTDKPQSVSFEEAGQGEVKHLLGANMLFEGQRAAALGFKPQQSSILAQIHEDLKEVQI